MKVILLSIILIISGCASSTHSSSNPTEGVLYAPKPVYPSLAFNRKITGKVHVKYDVDDNGRTQNIQVIKEWPEHYFTESAIQAISRMKYVKNHPKKGLVIKVTYKLSSNNFEEPSTTKG